MTTKARQLAEFIANADVDSDEIATGAVSASKLAATLDLSSKTISLPTLNQTLNVGGIVKSTRSNYSKVSLTNTDTPYEYQVENNGSNFRITDSTAGQTRVAINTTGYFGINTIAPAGRFHVVGTGGLTGGTPQNSGSGNQIVIENNASGGSADIQMLGPTNGYNHIFFGDADDANIGVIYYNHNNNSLNFTTNANTGSATLASNGKFGIGTPTPGDELTVVGQALFSYTDISASSSAQYAQVEIQKDDADANWSYLAFHESGSIAWQQGILDNKFVIASTGGPSKTSTDVERFTIDTSGNVGIGRSDPIDKLNVHYGSTETYSDTLTKGTNTQGLWVTNSNNDDNMAGIHLATGGGTHFSSIVGARTNNSLHWGTHLAFYTHDHSVSNLNTASEKMRINGDGKVGIGTQTPEEKIHVYGSGQQFIKVETTTTGAAAFVGMRMEDGDGDLGSIGDFGSGRRAFMLDTGSGVDMMFFTNNQNNSSDTPRLTITSGGNVGIGTTSPSVNKGLHIRGGLFIDNQTADPNNVSGDDQTLWVKKEDNKDWVITADGYTGTSTDYGIRIRTTTSAVYGLALQAGGSYRFRVQGDGNVLNSNNSYGSISDIKLKENIVDAASQWDDIKAIRVRKYSFISDNLDAPNQLGVIAQEVEEAGMGGLVSTTPDIDENKNLTGSDTKEVKYSILYMKAIKALQEAMSRIETLETEMVSVKSRIEALEG